MRPAGSLDEYVADPVGRYFSGNGFAHVYFEDVLCALVLWGSPGEDDVRVMVRAISSELPPRADHSSFVDARRLTGIDPAAYRLLSHHMGERGPAHDPNIIRHALIHPGGGVAGAAVAGFYAVTPTRTPERTGVFADAAAALAWLGRDDAPRILDLIARLVDDATGTPTIVRQVRERISARPRSTLRDVARTLGISSRSLQEQLQAAGTNFRREAASARIAVARQLMLESDAKLTAIAQEVGCASAQHFANLFRKVAGESPSAWRARNRRAP